MRPIVLLLAIIPLTPDNKQPPNGRRQLTGFLFCGDRAAGQHTVFEGGGPGRVRNSSHLKRREGRFDRPEWNTNKFVRIVRRFGVIKLKNAARTGILSELYIGRLILNRVRYVKDLNTGTASRGSMMKLRMGGYRMCHSCVSSIYSSPSCFA